MKGAMKLCRNMVLHLHSNSESRPNSIFYSNINNIYLGKTALNMYIANTRNICHTLMF